MAALSADAIQLASLLASLTVPDTAAIRQAEVNLKPILKDQRCVPILFEVLAARGTQPDAVRHVAGILLRKRISGHYKALAPETKSALQSGLLQLLSSEPERTVRNGAIGVSSTICKLECPALEQLDSAPSGFVPWPELFQLISQASQDASPDARELAFLLIQETVETIATWMSAQFAEMANLFRVCISSATEEVRVKTACVKALGGLMSFLSDVPEEEAFCSLIPYLLQYSAECQARSDEDTVATNLDALYDLAFSPSPTVTANLPHIVRFCNGCLKDDSLDMNIRDSAALVIATLAESKPKSFGRDAQLLAEVLAVIFQLIENGDESAAGAVFDNNPAWRDDVDADSADSPYDPEKDLDDKSATSIAQGMLDTIACELPKKYIFQQVVTMCVSRLNSPDERHRKAGIAGLGVIAEGCAEPLREHLGDIMPHVLRAAGDAGASVRECVCFALGQISEYCQPEVLGYAPQVLPVAFGLLDDTTFTVQATSCYVLEMFCEKLEPDAVRPFLDPLIRKLAFMLESTTKRSIQEMATAAIAATAVAAEEDFIPYIDGVAALMTKMMALKEEKMYSLRGRAIECMGHVAIAVGKDKFRPHFVETMRHACDGLTLDSTDLHEFAYALFANLSKVMGPEFSPCLPELVPHLLEVIQKDDGCFEAVARENQNQFGSLDDSDDEDAGASVMLQIRTGMLDAKKGAITAIGELSENCGAAYVPFLDQTVPLLEKAAKNWHPKIKAEVASALPSLVVAIVAADHAGDLKWDKGDINGANPMSARTLAVATAVLNQLVLLMEDDDAETVGKACEGIGSVIELCGPHALAIIANKCLENTLKLLKKEGQCQLSEDIEDIGDDEDDDDHELFMTSVCDLVAVFAQVMGPHFVQYLPQFLPAICAYAKTSRPITDRSMSLGCLGEIAQALGDSIKDSWKTVFLPAILVGLADADSNVKHNAAFTTGVCCEGLGQFAAGDYPQILQAISPLFSVDPNANDTSAACVDNAAAAVARMIMTCAESVPIDQVLPVILKAMPLKHDFIENDTVFRCLMGLIQGNHPQVVVQKVEFRRVFNEAIMEGSKVDDGLKEKLKLALLAPALA